MIIYLYPVYQKVMGFSVIMNQFLAQTEKASSFSAWIYGVYIGIIAIGLILLFIISRKSRKPIKKDYLSYKAIEDRWNQIKDAKGSNDINKLRSALLKADKLVDHVLQKKGYTGETLALKVKQARKDLGDTYEKFWDAHRTRNRLVHEIEDDVRYHEAQEALNKYEEVLQKLGIK